MKRSILIVDDEFGLADIVSEMLAERGFDVMIAINGQQALERMAEQAPDLVLLDCMMPVLDGPAVLSAMAAEPRLAAVPVILMTATPHAVPAEAAAACRTVLAKPFAPQVLFDAIDAALTG